MSLTRDGSTGDRERPVGSPPAPEAIFDALESDLRKAVVFVLSATEPPVDVDRLIDGLLVDVDVDGDGDDADVGVGVGVGADDDTTHESTATAVRRVHLPALERIGVVRYDRHSGVVRTTADLTWLVTLLRETDRFDGH
jgi:hypothetical protein